MTSGSVTLPLSRRSLSVKVRANTDIRLQSDQKRLCHALTKTAEAAILELFMPKLTFEGEKVIAGIAARYGSARTP